MILFINSSDFNNVTFALISKEVKAKTYAIDPHKSHLTLGYLDKFLKSSKINPKEIKKIVACKGPGSYTGVRIGVTIAQALGFAWGIPVTFIATQKIPKDLSKLK